MEPPFVPVTTAAVEMLAAEPPEIFSTSTFSTLAVNVAPSSPNTADPDHPDQSTSTSSVIRSRALSEISPLFPMQIPQEQQVDESFIKTALCTVRSIILPVKRRVQQY
jgi:hypothetical protein